MKPRGTSPGRADRTTPGARHRQEYKRETGRSGTPASRLRHWIKLWAAMAVVGAAMSVSAADLVFQQVAAGVDHTVALKRDGTLWAWGANGDGELGDGTTVSKSNPVQVGTWTNWQAVAAGGYHAVALKHDGTLWAWGYNAFGQLGDGSTVWRRLSPVQVGTGTNWQAAAAGCFHTVALKQDGNALGLG